MFSYLLISQHPFCPQDFKRQSIFGHSMGGHGALTLYLSSTTKQYRSASAFAPISNPTKCPWGEKAFNGYLQGGVEEAKEKYDATELISKSKEPVHILIDYASARLFTDFTPTHWSLQGTGDNFYKQGQLLPENFLKAARDSGYDEFQVRVRSQEDYDHSYYFVSIAYLHIVCLIYSATDFVFCNRPHSL